MFLDLNNFAKFKDAKLLGSSYDIYSVMHYSLKTVGGRKNMVLNRARSGVRNKMHQVSEKIEHLFLQNNKEIEELVGKTHYPGSTDLDNARKLYKCNAPSTCIIIYFYNHISWI